MAFTVKFRRDSVEHWSTINPILQKNEVGRVSPTGEFKVGDGSTPWNDLAYSTTLPENIIMVSCYRYPVDSVKKYYEDLVRRFQRGQSPR